MITLGIDPGIATTGYGIVEEDPDGRLTTLGFGVIQTDPNQTLEKRLVKLYNKIVDLIVLHRPDEGAVEKLFFERNVKTAINVGQARGVALLALADVNLSVGEYTPLEVKQAVVGYGGADKNQVQQMVKMLLGLDSVPHPDDAADALAVAICHLHSRRFKKLISNEVD